MSGKSHFFLFRAAGWALADPVGAVRKCWAWFRHAGVGGCWTQAARRFASGTRRRPSPQQMTPEVAARVLAGCSRQPPVSIVTPVHEVLPGRLDSCIRSVAAQYYRHWELLLVDDGGASPELAELMNGWAARDGRIRLHRIERGAGPAAGNEGLAMAGGDFVGFLEPDGELTPDALAWMVRAVNLHPGARWLYSDEDRIAADGTYCDPVFKPDYSPAYLLACAYACHFSLYETSGLRRAGGLRPEFDGAQDHDLALRASETVEREHVVHVPRILYHRRAGGNSAARPAGAEPHAAESGRRAVEEALTRRGIAGRVASSPWHPAQYRLELAPRRPEKVTVIVPTRNAAGLLARCIASLRAHTAYPRFGVLVIDNRSDEPELLEYLAAESAGGRLDVMKYDRPFNHSDMNNLAVRTVDSELVVLMNNDVEIVSDGWLEQLVGALQADAAAAGVGAQLLFPDGRVQHGGVVLGINGAAGHAHRALPASGPGYFGRLHCLQEWSAVTAALVLLRRSAFLDVGGFNAERYPTSFNDVDLWLRLGQSGGRCLYNPEVRAVHHETGTRRIVPAEEHEFARRFAADWGDRLDHDPFYNPNLSLQNEQFAGFRDFPVEKELGHA